MLAPSCVIKKMEPVPLRGSHPSTYIVDEPSADCERGLCGGLIWGAKKGVKKAPFGGGSKQGFWALF